jgi:hypothetical protein
MNKIFCDDCKSDINIKIKSKKVGEYKGENIRFHYFKCNECKRKYFVSVDSKRVRKLQKIIKANNKKIKQIRDNRIRSVDGAQAQDREIERLSKVNDDCRRELIALTGLFKNMFKL